MDAATIIERARLCTGAGADRATYEGSRAELLAAGLVPPGAFPGDDGRAKLRTSFVDDAGRYGTIKRQRRAGVETFRLELLGGSQAERQARAWYYRGRPAIEL